MHHWCTKVIYVHCWQWHDAGRGVGFLIHFGVFICSDNVQRFLCEDPWASGAVWCRGNVGCCGGVTSVMVICGDLLGADFGVGMLYWTRLGSYAVGVIGGPAPGVLLCFFVVSAFCSF